MANQNNFGSYTATSFSSASYTTSSSSSSSDNPQGTGSSTSKRWTETMQSNDREGTAIRRTTEETGRPSRTEDTFIPPRDGGRGLEQQGGGGAERGRIEDVTDADDEQARRDREYEERMEDEYAKREGGA